MIMRHEIRAWRHAMQKHVNHASVLLDIIASYVYSYYKVHDLCGVGSSLSYNDICIIICGVDDNYNEQ